MMYNLQYNLKTKGKSIALVLLIISMVGLVAVSNVAHADGTVSATVTAYARDNSVIDDGTATSAAYKKVVTASIPSNDHSGTNTWRWAKSSSSTCDNTVNFTYSGSTATLTSESDNDKYICFRVNHTVGSHDYLQNSIQISGIDTTKPKEPTGLDLATEDDTGPNTADNITKTTTVTINGCAEADSKVTVYVNGAAEDAVADASGTTCTNKEDTAGKSWTKDITLVARSSAHSITARATDAVGNISSRSKSLSIKVDTTKPTVSYGAPKITGGETAGGVTYLNEGDTVEIPMTFSDSQSGVRSMVQPIVEFFGTDNASLGQITATGSNTKRTAKYTVASADSVTLDSLGYQVTNASLLTDLAGNPLAAQSTVRPINDVVVDTTAPEINGGTLTITNASTLSTAWAVADDDLEVAVTFNETIDEGETDIKYKIGSGREQTFTYTTGQLTSGRCRRDSGVTTVARYKCQYTVRSGESGLFQARIDSYKDLAGNAGTTGAAGSYNTTGITIDTTIAAPSKIILKNTVKPRDSDLSPIFVVTVAETGGTVTLYSDSSCSTAISTAEPVTDTRPTYTVEVSVSGYEDGDDGLHTVYADYADAAGNDPVCSTASATYTLDTTAPTVEEVGYYSDASLTQKITSGKVANGGNIYTKVKFDEVVKYRSGLTANARPVIKHDIDEEETKYRIVGYTSTLSSGRCRPYSTSSNASATYICRYIVRSNDIGDFKIIVDSATEDPLGHSMDDNYEHDETLALDSTAPGKPTDMDLDDEDDSGDDVEDNITNTTTGLTITGCAETDSTVALYSNGIAITDATDTANGSSSDCTNSSTDSAFSIDISLTTDGTHQITARATDDSNNTSAASSVLRVTIDTTGPTATMTGAPTGATKVDTLDVTVAGTDVTHYKSAVVTGTSCANASYGSEVAVATKLTDSVSVADGKATLCVIGRDKTGNWQANASATKATWTQDLTGPAKPTKLDLAAADDSGLLDTDNTTKNTTGLTITGCAEANSTVTLYEDGTALTGTVTASGSTGCTGALKQFTKDIALTSGDQAYTITAKAADASNNMSEASDALTITIKSIAPTITAGTLDLAAADDSGTNDDDRTKTLEDLTISGTLSSNPATGDYVQLYDGTTLLTNATDNSFDGVGARDWSADFSLPSNTRDGVRTINAKVHDIAGNAGTATSITITIDTTGPSVSVTKHPVSPTTDLTPEIKIRTSDPGTVSFGGACTDTSTTPTVQTVVAGENTVTLPTLENTTYTDCTVMVTDTTDNTSTGTRINTFIVDNTPPTIAGAAFANVDRTQITMTMNEAVYAPSTPAASDFRIQIGTTVYSDLVSGISGLRTSRNTATQSFTLTTTTTLPATGTKVLYTKGTNHILDQIGNPVESFDGTNAKTTITDTRFVKMILHANDDTGHSSIDGLTTFDGDAVTITVSFDDGTTTFKNGEKVRIFKGSGQEVALYTVSTIVGQNFVQAHGQASFDVNIPKSQFRPGLNSLTATYTPTGGVLEGNIGAPLNITYDTSAPRISITGPSTSPATQKTISATDRDNNTTSVTTWAYKVLTESVQLCNEAAMASNTTVYTEGDDLTFAKSTDNGNRVCFSSEDAAGNTTYKVSNTINRIDGSAPTVTSAATSSSGGTIKVTLSEPVYAATAPSLSDFKVVSISDGIEYNIERISDLGTSRNDAKNSFVITLPFTAPNTAMTLKYTEGTNKITDVIGNPLASFEDQRISRVRVVSLALDAIDDTGTDPADGLTRFDGDEVSIVVTPSEGVFANGEVVRLFISGNKTPVRSYTVSPLPGSLYKDIAGQASFIAVLSKSAFTEGANTLYATYKAYGTGTNEERGGNITVTYDKTAPSIDITNPTTDKEQRKVVYAEDGESTETVWQAKQIAGTTTCEEDEMTGAATYEEGSRTALVFNEESDNNTKVCFSATDKAGNVAYEASNRLNGIDVTAPALSSASITNITRDTTKVIFTEPIYAETAVNPRDFTMLAGNRQYIVTSITGLESTAETAQEEIILKHISIRESDAVTLRYVKSGSAITDVAGNEMENFTKTVANKPFVTLELTSKDDTGVSESDGITTFDGNEASFTVSITSGTFAEGDQVYIYQKGKDSAIQAIAVPTAGSSFVTSLEKRLFSEGTVTLLAGHIPSGTFNETTGTEYSFTYDKTGPQIRVTNPSDDSTSAMKKRVSATDLDDDSDQITDWAYKVITLDGDTTCDADSMSSDTTEYTEGATIDLQNEQVNGKVVCFSSTDIAGNTSYATSAVLEGIDITKPTVTSATLDNFARTRTVVVFSEPVYATSSNLAFSDFSIDVTGTGYKQEITGIENLPTTAATARTTLVFTHPALSEQRGSALVYTKGSDTLADIAGNTVDGFNQSISKSAFITLDLAEKDDLGKDRTDNYTRFDGSTMSIVASLTNGGQFSNGDVITLYRGNNRQPLKTLTVSSYDADDTVIADGARSFAIVLQNSAFIENGVTSLSAAYAPVGTIGINKVGGVLRVTVDTAAPKISVSGLDTNPASSKRVSAVDEDDAGDDTTATTDWVLQASEEWCGM